MIVEKEIKIVTIKIFFYKFMFRLPQCLFYIEVILFWISESNGPTHMNGEK